MIKQRKIFKPSESAAAVVTGAASGIGRSFAYEIIRRGGSVICADVNEQGAKEVAAELSELGQGLAIPYGCDVRDAKQVEQLAEEADSLLQRPVSLLVNNAGVWVGGRMGEVSLEDWHWCVDVNLWGVIHGCHFFTPKLRNLGHGGIINVASVASYAAVPTFTTYNVTKAAVAALSETMAAELTGTDINITVLCPTAVKTNIIENGNLPSETGNLASNIMGKWMFSESPDEVARQTLTALDKKQLYMMPQFDSRLVWRMKRYAPNLYTKAVGEIYRLNTN